MNAKIRARLFYIFIFFFVVITMFTSLYATGYRFNLTWPLEFEGILIKTGTLQIKTEPKGVKVFLDKSTKNIFSNTAKIQGQATTPVKIRNLLPGEYKLSLKEQGYWTWEKKINIEPGVFLYLDNITLFKKTLPLNIYSTEVQDLYPSPDYKYAYLSQEQAIIDLKTENKIGEIDEKTDNVTWSQDSEKLITNNLIYDVRTNTVNTFSDDIEGDIDNFQCSDDAKTISYQQEEIIKQYDVKKSEDNILISTKNNCQDFIIKNNKLIYIINNNKESQLIINNLDDDEKTIINLPLANNYQFINTDNKYLNILEKNHQTLYILDDNSRYSHFLAKINNFKEGVWINDYQLLYISDLEFFIHDLRINESELITRVSDKIDSLLWHDNKQYILYTSDSSLFAIDWTNRKYTITKIITLEEIKSPFLDQKNDTVYFTAKIGQQSGLYKMQIQ
ncbi:MAG: PEGA domain-containing protein [Parcubacteria group bacterium]